MLRGNIYETIFLFRLRHPKSIWLKAISINMNFGFCADQLLILKTEKKQAGLSAILEGGVRYGMVLKS